MEKNMAQARPRTIPAPPTPLAAAINFGDTGSPVWERNHSLRRQKRLTRVVVSKRTLAYPDANATVVPTTRAVIGRNRLRAADANNHFTETSDTSVSTQLSPNGSDDEKSSVTGFS
jgi:hypothetical protein